VTVPDLKRNSQDTSAFYLEKIYQFQVLADSGAPRPSTAAQPSPFSAPNYAIWVNSLWFLSLCISLTGAMISTLQQQWARRYLKLTQPPRSSPHDRARMREFFANGVDSLHFSRVVEAVPTLIHLSLFLFFAGLLIFLFNVNQSVFFAVVWWVGVSAMAYLAITFMPMIWLDSPYRAPLSSPAGRISAGVLYLAFGIFSDLACFKRTVRRGFHSKSKHYSKWVSRGIKKITERFVRETSSEIDGRVLKRTFNALAEDHELEKFFQTIPGFCSSSVVKDPRRVLHGSLGEWELSLGLLRFLERTWLSNLVSESDKQRRFIMCVNVVDAAYLHHATWWIHNAAVGADWYGGLRSVEMGHSLRRRGKRSNPVGLFAQSIVAQTIADVQRSNDRWVALATDQLGDAVPRYLEHSNESLLLANLIHITRQIFSFSSGVNLDMANTISDFALPSLSRFDVQNALPEVQREFCALWNKIVSDMQNRADSQNAIGILNGIRHIYIALHQDTDACPEMFSASIPNYALILCDPSSYPLCELSDHQSTVSGGAAPQTTPQFSGTTTAPALIPGSPSPPVLILASGSALSTSHQPSAGSVVSRSGPPPRGPAPSSSSPATPFSGIAPQVPSLSNTNVTSTILSVPSMENTVAPRGDDSNIEDTVCAYCRIPLSHWQRD
jgi:Family of unknown function (DUF6535)